MSLEILLKESWKKRLPAQKWLSLARQLFDRQKADLSDELCELLMTQLTTIIPSSPILLNYLITALTSEPTPLIHPKILIRFITKTQPVSVTAREWDDVLLPLLQKLSEEGFKNLKTDQERREAGEILADLLSFISRALVAGTPKHTLSNRQLLTEPTPSLLAPSPFVLDLTMGATPNPSMGAVGATPKPEFSMELDMDSIADLDMTDTSQVVVGGSSPTKGVSPSSTTSNKRKHSDMEGLSPSVYQSTFLPAQTLAGLTVLLATIVSIPVRHSHKSLRATLTLLQPLPRTQEHIGLLKLIRSQLNDTSGPLPSEVSKPRKSVHLTSSRYRDAEDEGRGQAMCSAGVMALVYSLAQLRPVPADATVLQRLITLQRIKAAWNESFYLELLIAGLVGLAESVQWLEMRVKDGVAAEIEAEERVMLWKSVVLVKLPHLISLMEEHKKQTQPASQVASPTQAGDVFELDLLMEGVSDDDRIMTATPVESSLIQLKAFRGLINACTYPVNSSANILKDLVRVGTHYGFVRRGMVPRILAGFDQLAEMGLMDLDVGDITEEDIMSSLTGFKELPTAESAENLLTIAMGGTVHARTLTSGILQLLQSYALTRDLTPLTHLATALLVQPRFLDLLFLLHHPSELIEPLEVFLDGWQYLGHGDSNKDDSDVEGLKVAYEGYGKIWAILVDIVQRFELHSHITRLFRNPSGFVSRFFTQTPTAVDQSFSYGIETEEQREDWIARWLSALYGDGGISDELIGSSTPQALILLSPILFSRALAATETGVISNFDTLIGGLEYFLEGWLSYVLVPGVMSGIMEDGVLDGSDQTLPMQVLDHLLGSDRFPQYLLRLTATQLASYLMTTAVVLQQQAEFRRREAGYEQHPSRRSSYVDPIETPSAIGMTPLLVEEPESDKHLWSVIRSLRDRIARIIPVSRPRQKPDPRELFRRTRTMLHNIIISGRYNFARDAIYNEADARPNYMDMVVFREALWMGGAKWFVTVIVDEVLEVAKKVGAVRAAELGAELMTVELVPGGSMEGHNSPANLLRVLLVDVIPWVFERDGEEEKEKKLTYRQGQTLGIFVSHVMLLSQTGDELVQLFLKALQEGGGWVIGDAAVGAAWRGFVKGLLSDEMIQERWEIKRNGWWWEDLRDYLASSTRVEN